MGPINTQSGISLKRIILFAVPPVVIVVALFIALVVLPFHLIKSTPASKNFPTDSPSLILDFNKPLENVVQLSGSDSSIKGYSVSGKVLTISLNYPLNANQRYSITLNQVTATSGAQITHKVISFITKDIDPSKLSAAQQKALLDDQDQNLPSDPILSHLPYQTLEYEISAEITANQISTQALVLQIQIFIPAAFVGDASVEAQYKQDALNYITSLGLNPANYSINYQIVNG
jgi:hypothetical protein